MGKMKGGAGLSYTSLTAQLRMLRAKPHSVRYTHDFSRPEYQSGDSLRSLAEKRGLYIGTIAQEDDTYKQYLPGQFDSLTCGNAMKWGWLSREGRLGEYDYARADAIVDYAVAQGCRMRGHTLVWGRNPPHSYPGEVDRILQASATPKEDLRSILRAHVTEVVGHFKGRVRQWDVVNEPFSVYDKRFADYTFYQVLGKEYIFNAFRYAKEADSSLSLVLNEQFFFYRDARAKAFLALVREMKERDIPLDTVGLQHHVMFVEQDIDDFRWFIGQLDALGLKFEITELDIRQKIFQKAPDMALAQAEAYYAILCECVNAPHCTGVTLWGTDDGNSWYDHMAPFAMRCFQPNAPLLFDAAGRKKPAYYAVQYALRQHREEIR